MSDAIPVNRIKGVGEKTAALFGKINVYTVDDLISHYPRDYETYDAPVSIREVSAGSVQAIYGQITAIPNVKKVRNLSILNAVLTDDNGDSIQLTFFNMSNFKKVLNPADSICSVVWYSRGALIRSWNSPECLPGRNIRKNQVGFCPNMP